MYAISAAFFSSNGSSSGINSFDVSYSNGVLEHFNDKEIEHCKVYGSGNMSNKLISDITTFIDEHYSEDIALQDIASVLGYSDVYFCKLFKQNFGKNFITYLNEYRMAKAKELLANPLINIKDVGQKAGYRDANYFTRVFKRMVGMTPSEYRIGVLGS